MVVDYLPYVLYVGERRAFDFTTNKILADLVLNDHHEVSCGGISRCKHVCIMRSSACFKE
ncbi:hypothetical protein NC99_20320 [Sunxiuqinia dokdonensis]|uniref:Uncharacterized protein n=1 Tax=Sunxiuqinia dokdonensis TaxID=1409788 RepID=A0A0L8V9N1_9BACT|nr:hypothetical protein NC99_20320 [Sunxiuqinia dokdonensis]